MDDYYRSQGIPQQLDGREFWDQQRQQFDVHSTRDFYEPFQQAYPMGGFVEQSQIQYYLCSQPYNFGWHEHYEPYPHHYNSCCYEQSNMNFDYQVNQTYYEPPC